MLGVQRPSLNKILEEFERDGIIETGYAAIQIRDADRLREIQRRFGPSDCWRVTRVPARADLAWVLRADVVRPGQWCG